MHPAVYIPIGVPLQFARTYNLETMGKKKKKKRDIYASLGQFLIFSYK